MKNNTIRQLIGFFSLGLSVYFIKDMRPGAPAFIIATGAALLFSYLHSIKMALTNMRTIVLLFVAFSILFFAFSDDLPSFSTEHQTGAWLGGDLNPGQIQRLRLSHKVALELYLDHTPHDDDRYFKIGVLNGSLDGLNYKTLLQSLDDQLMPQAKNWAAVNLREIGLEEKVKRIEKWWKRDFTYSLEPGAILGGHPLDHFLFRSKKGFCEHYAAALSSLLRLDGIKTRVVVGFYGGVWNPFIHRLTFEEADAHAWVEALNPLTHHWKVLDPTFWVYPDLNHRKIDYSIMICVLVVFGGLIAVIYIFRSRNRDPLYIFKSKIEKLEKKFRLSMLGKTFSERVDLLIFSSPSLKTELKESHSLYLKKYYSENSTPKTELIFLASLRKW